MSRVNGRFGSPKHIRQPPSHVATLRFVASFNGLIACSHLLGCPAPLKYQPFDLLPGYLQRLVSSKVPSTTGTTDAKCWAQDSEPNMRPGAGLNFISVRQTSRLRQSRAAELFGRHRGRALA
jgi:hypothetical protein